MAVAALPQEDARLTQIRHLNLRYELPEYRSVDEWERRAQELRLHVRIACGLFPMLPKTPLNPRRVICYEDEDVIVERVTFESMPNFFVTGNLYRPKRGKPPYPAVLHPHGHVPQPEGRLYKREQIRAMAMAKLGFIVFAYDMVGYGDQFQVVHRSPETPKEHLWAISKGGIQTWNSIRAIDFLLSLPEVDKNRIGCCGSSGGGTQTFLLAAVDERLAVAVPAKMVSAHMQGGCICENPPILRIDTCNPEIIALFAPRPLLLISDDGDWTKETPKYEFPFVKSVYKLLKADDRCSNAHFSEGHEFAQASREAYYSWAIQWLKNDGKPPEERVKEPESKLPNPEQLRIWGDDLPKPKDAITWDGLVSWIKEQANTAIEQMMPKDEESLKRFCGIMRQALRRVLVADIPPENRIIVREDGKDSKDGLVYERLWLGRVGVGEKIPALLIGDGRSKEGLLILSDDGAASKISGGNREILGFVRRVKSRFDVLAIDAFLTGMAVGERKRDVQFFATYNRTDDAERVQDVLTALAFLKSRYGRVHIVGFGISGLWALLAKAISGFDGKIAADAAQFDASNDDEYVKRLYIPCLRRVGDFRAVLALIAPNPLYIHNSHKGFPTIWAKNVREILGGKWELILTEKSASIDDLANWLMK
ncbi:MAG: hypothetical protein GDYSWBUE_000580 [Candidatus Fervidibacterota bacterium]